MIPFCTCILPLPPSINRYLVPHVRTGRRVLSPEARAWKEYATHLLNTTIQIDSLAIQQLQANPVDLLLDLTFYLPDQRKRDISNMIKVVEDLLAHSLNIDDRWNKRIILTRELDPAAPRCTAKWFLYTP